MVSEVSAHSGLVSLFLECVDGNIVSDCHGKECFLLDTPPLGIKSPTHGLLEKAIHIKIIR